MKKDFYNKAINLINEIRFVKETQLQKFLKIDENTTDNLINSLIRKGYAKKISVLNDTYIVPYNYLYNEKEFEKTKNEVIENGKALDLLIHISKRNVVTEYYLCSKKPVNLVFICEFTNRDTKEREYKLFEYLYKNKNRIVPKDELFSAVWGDSFYSDGTLNVHIRKLREKLEKNPNEPEYIKTVWGTGYILTL